ncbi:MAG: cytochrome b/b6 domain-containing protein [Alphaproteobacteria bacterium]
MPDQNSSDPSADQPKMIAVWDPLVRVFHWSLVAGFTLAFLSDGDNTFHQIVGYVAAGLIGFRLIWGIVGSRHARFSDFVTGPAKIAAYLAAVVRLRAPRFIGHNPAGGAMVIILMIMVAIVGLTGWLAVQPSAAKLWEEAHEVVANLTVVLIAIHVTGAIVTGLAHRENLVKAMITGRKRP